MQDSPFEKTVILICHHDNEGAIGLVINRPDSIMVAEVLDEINLPKPANTGESTWWGGPVGRNTCFVIWKGHASESEGWTIASEIAVSQSVDRLRTLIEMQKKFYLTVGYSGWGPQQLDEEIKRGSWLYADADPMLLFNTPCDDRYQEALRLLGLNQLNVWMQPIDE